MSLYWLIDLLAVSVPFLFSFHRRLQFHKTWYALRPALLITAAVFILWDILFTGWQVWGFNPDYLQGFYIAGLPVEELFFFIAIPYACVFTYASLNRLIHRDLFAGSSRFITAGLIGVLGLAGAANITELYTSVTFLATACFLIFHFHFLKSPYLGRFYLAYLVVFLGPFLLVNGVLTGSFVRQPVVWYDNSENLGIRFLTIPVEDFVYGFLLFLMNVTFYEGILARRNTG